MQFSVSWAFLSSFLFRGCLSDVTWTPVGCDGWSFKGANINQIWDNAIQLTDQAQSRIDAIPKTFSFKWEDEEKRAGGNANFMFGVKFGKLSGGLDAAGQTTMATVKTNYGDIKKGLEGTLSGLDPKSAFLFCGNSGLTYSAVKGQNGGVEFWHGEVETAVSDPNNPQETITSTEYIILESIGLNKKPPCEEDGVEYTGKTFVGQRVNNGDISYFYGIILCPNRWTGAVEGQEIKIAPTLDLNYRTSAAGKKYAYPPDYNSASGILVHEMMHVVGRTRNTQYVDENLPGQLSRVGFKDCVALAKGEPATALTNPDSYRLFAQMSMSPATEWGI